MTERLFVSQNQLEMWLEAGEVTFENDLLTVLSDGVSYHIEAAVRVVSVLDGGDAAGLVGKELGISELAARGAEHYRDSLILGDAAYQCEEGFVGVRRTPPEPTAADASGTVAAPAPEAADQSASATPEVDGESSDSDLLADFMLKHM